MKKLIVFTALLCSLSSGITAQSTDVIIDIETALKIAGSDNLQIEYYKRMQDLAKANLDESRDWFLPEVYAGGQVHKLNGTAMNADGRFFTDVDRENFWGGVGINATWDFADGIFETKARNLNSQASKYRTQHERNEMLLQVIYTYYDLLLSNLQGKAYNRLMQQADTIYRQMEIQVSVGIQFESDLLLASSNKAQLEIDKMQVELTEAENSTKMKRLLNLPPGSNLIIRDAELKPVNLTTEQGGIEQTDSLFKIQPQYKAFQMDIKALNTAKKTSTTALLFPDLSVNAYSSQFGDVFSPLDPTNALNASLTWRVPLGSIFYGGENDKYKAKIALKENRLEQNKAMYNEDLHNATENLRVRELQIIIALKAMESAEKALKQSKQRQDLGIVRPYELLQAQETLLKSWLNYLEIVSVLNKSKYRHYVLSGNNL